MKNSGINLKFKTDSKIILQLEFLELIALECCVENIIENNRYIEYIFSCNEDLKFFKKMLDNLSPSMLSLAYDK